MDSPYSGNIFATAAIRDFHRWSSGSVGSGNAYVSKQEQNRVRHLIEYKVRPIADRVGRFLGDLPFRSILFLRSLPFLRNFNLREFLLEDRTRCCSVNLVLNLYHYHSTFRRIEWFVNIAIVDGNYYIVCWLTRS